MFLKYKYGFVWFLNNFLFWLNANHLISEYKIQNKSHQFPIQTIKVYLRSQVIIVDQKDFMSKSEIEMR